MKKKFHHFFATFSLCRNILLYHPLPKNTTFIIFRRIFLFHWNIYIILRQCIHCISRYSCSKGHMIIYERYGNYTEVWHAKNPKEDNGKLSWDLSISLQVNIHCKKTQYFCWTSCVKWKNMNASRYVLDLAFIHGTELYF